MLAGMKTTPVDNALHRNALAHDAAFAHGVMTS